MIRRLVLTCLAALAATSLCLGDVLVLKDGRRIEGTIRSETDKLVRIETSLGQLEFERAKIASIERGKSSKAEFEDRWNAAATAEDFHALGAWAEERKMRTQAKKCMARAVELDPKHAGANTWLGNVEYKGEWMTPAQRDARMQADLAADMAARGLVLHEGAWVTPGEKEKLERGLVLHEGRWMPFDEAQRAKGLELFEGAWMPRIEALARNDAALAAKAAGRPFATFVNEQALLAGPGAPAELVTVGGGIIAGRAWFDGLFGCAPGLELLGGRLAEFYLFGSEPGPYADTVPLFASWTKTVPEGWAAAVAKVHGFLWWDPFPLSSARRWHREDYDLSGHCYHHWGHLLLNRLGYDGRLLPPWYDESFAGLMESKVHGRNAVFCRAQAEAGRGTSARNATFSFDPKLLREGKWREVLKDALAANRVRHVDKLAQLEFSELELLDVATGMGILEWLQSLPAPEPGTSALAAFHRELRAGAPEVPFRVIAQAQARNDVYDAAFRAAAGMGWQEADRAWRSWFSSQ